MKWNIERVREFVQANSECTLVSEEYVNNTSNLEFICKCGNPFTTSIKMFARQQAPKRQCNACGHQNSNKNKTYTVTQVAEYASSIGLTLLNTTYKNCKTNLDFQCMCGNVFQSTFDYIKNGQRRKCFECQPKEGNLRKQGDVPYNRKTHEDFLNELHELYDDEYDVLDEYQTCKHKIRMKHNCGHVWQVDPDHVLNHQTRCPNCYDTKNSKASKDVENWLIKNNVSFQKEYRIDECRYKRPLPFDFAIFDGNELKLLIEVDGQQHYDFFRYIKDETVREEKFRLTQLRDKIKTDYCKQQQIPLLRIPYYEIKNIDSLLQEAMLIPSQASESTEK